MTNKRRRVVRYKQRMLNRKYAFVIMMNIIIVLVIMFIALMVGASGNNKNEGDSKPAVYESEDNHIAVTTPANTPLDVTEQEAYETIQPYCRNLSDNDKLMLAKIAMAEAEGESIYTKVLVILTVLNRVESKRFPNTVEDVIFQNRNNVYQFSPVIPGGRYWTTEPSNECWEAVEMVNEMVNDVSEGALYFESCVNPDNWHSRNLEFLFESDGMRFYK